jgi:hypothetical protein
VWRSRLFEIPASKPSASPGHRICQHLLRLITRSSDSTLVCAISPHIPASLTSNIICATAETTARWRPRQNTRMSHSATASKKQATANRLLHTRPNLSPEMPGLRTTMFPTTSRYTYKACPHDRNIKLTTPSSAAPSQKQPSLFACSSFARSTRS